MNKNIIQTNPERIDTLRLTQEFNDRFFNHTRKV
jgi:hypothetical protein